MSDPRELLDEWVEKVARAAFDDGFMRIVARAVLAAAMSEHARRRFPLDGTSTVRMSGKAVYNLVRHDRPEPLPGDAEAFREAVKDAMADAWDEGYHGTGGRGHHECEATNPYREDSHE